MGCMLPSSYLFAKQFDILGPTIAGAYNINYYLYFPYCFLYKYRRLFPFTPKSVFLHA